LVGIVSAPPPARIPPELLRWHFLSPANSARAPPASLPRASHRVDAERGAIGAYVVCHCYPSRADPTLSTRPPWPRSHLTGAHEPASRSRAMASAMLVFAQPGGP